MKFCRAVFIVILALAALTSPAAEIEMPRVLDGRLKLELFAAEPDIVTPTGMGVDEQGRVLCIESHTHFRPTDYDGPPKDRIRRFEDTDGDGKADKITTFYEGSTATMSVACHPGGGVYVATRDDIFRLRDTDNDGVADENTPLVHLESADEYPHSGLAGFAFAANGDVYFGLGENHALRFNLKGSDGAVLTNLEGGHIYRMQPDGSRLERVSVGCWNPHASAVDDAGRLFTVDNDPDSLPPCRLLHVVPRADFGYKYRNGRKGTHPFTAWNGELPDTLPMVAGTGEAPSGILVCGRKSGADRLPADYCGNLLVTSWGDHRIERYALKPRGASVSAERTDIVVGGENFRPVGIVAGGDGAIYFSDWVDKSYTLHKKGRIWRLSIKEPLSKDDKKPAEPMLSEDERRAESLRSTVDPADAKRLWAACDDADPFIQQAAREGLKRIGAVKPQLELKSLSAKQRLAAMCVLRDLDTEEAQARLPEFLSDADPDIRLVALKWIGEEGVKSARPALDRVLTAGPTTSRLFAAYLAAIEKLDKPPKKDNQEWASEQYVAEALVNEGLPIEVRRWALRTLRPDHPAITSARLKQWLASPDQATQLEAIRTLRESTVNDRESLLRQIAADSNRAVALRCEAIVGLSPSSEEQTNCLLTLAGDADLQLANEALRSLRGAKLDGKVLQQLAKIGQAQPSLADSVRRILDPDDLSGIIPAASDLDAWVARLDGPGDAAAGERVFFHQASAGCAKCHQVDGRGGRIGPDLTVGARALDRRRLIESILSPSKEIAPQFTVWNLATDDGKIHTGILLSENAKEATQTFGNADGKTFTLKIADIESRQTQPNSVMPTGLEKLMTTQEFRDLLAFLQRSN